MKYVIAVLPENEPTEEEIKSRIYCGEPPLNTEEDAIAQASKTCRAKNGPVGIFKLVKRLDPPDVKIKDITN